MQGLAEGPAVGRLAPAHQERADDRSDHPGERDGQGKREEGKVGAHRGLFGTQPEGERNERYRGDNRTGVTLEQVGTHAGHIADVVAHIVCDGCRVPGVVLRDSRLDLPDKVCSDVGGLGVDTASNPCEQSDRRGPEAVSRNHLEGFVHLGDENKQDVHESQTAEGQSGDREAHHGTASESNRQGFARSVLGGVGGPCVGHSGNGHTGVAGCGRKRRAHHVGEGRSRCDENPDDRRHDGHEHGHPCVLLAQKRSGSLLDLDHQMHHSVVAGRCRFDVPVEVAGQDESHQGRQQSEIGNGVQGSSLLVFRADGGPGASAPEHPDGPGHRRASDPAGPVRPDRR